MNILTTCRCISPVSIDGHAFHKDREYQLDVIATAECDTYIVYPNGTSEDSISIGEEMFKTYFLEINPFNELY